MINLEIVTPEKKVIEIDVDSVSLPTAKGEIGILPKHAPLISTLGPGILSYSVSGTTEQMVVSGGFVEVSGNKVSILADIAENKSEIDVDAARAEKVDSEKVLGAWTGNEEGFEVEFEKLEKAQARLRLASKK